MKGPAMLIGIVLIALGMIALVYQGITYTTREKVVDLGPLKITAQKEKIKNGQRNAFAFSPP